MKNLFLLFCLAMMAWACSSNSFNGEDEIPAEPKEYIVSLGMVGEILDIEESPLTKASGNDLYGVQVYYKTSNTEYKPYAYGIFDDKSLMEIKLLSGYSYCFKVRMFPNSAKYQGGIEDDGHKYFDSHFWISDIINENVCNCFKSSNNSILNISKVTTDLNFICDGVEMNTYYGELRDYVPSENESISIELKLACFGVKFIADNLIEGNLSINIEGYSSFTLYPDNSETKKVFNFKSFEGISFDDNYSDNIYLTVVWNHPSAGSIPMIKKEIVVKRNMLTTITINVKDTSTNSAIDLTKESEEMGAGDNIVL